MDTATVGKIVHFIEPGPEDQAPASLHPLAAIVTKINQDKTIGLSVFHPDGKVKLYGAVHASEEYKAGHWTWPPRA